jgi:hypothetical protein
MAQNYGCSPLQQLLIGSKKKCTFLTLVSYMVLIMLNDQPATKKTDSLFPLLTSEAILEVNYMNNPCNLM